MHLAIFLRERKVEEETFVFKVIFEMLPWEGGDSMKLFNPDGLIVLIQQGVQCAADFREVLLMIIWKPGDVCTQHKPHEPCCQSPYESGMHAKSVNFIISHLIQCATPSCFRKLSKHFRECRVTANRPSACSSTSPSVPSWLEGIDVLKVNKLSYVQGVQRSLWRLGPHHLSGDVRAPGTFCR